ncbi:MAG: PsiF family protein [Thiobacillus sp.]
MKAMWMAAVMAGVLASSGVWAEGAQQNRMKACNEDAGKQGVSGDARKAFMKSCLSGGEAAKPTSGGETAKPASGGVTPQQQRMKDCNAEAKSKEMKGDARKAFMKSCLSNKKN